MQPISDTLLFVIPGLTGEQAARLSLIAKERTIPAGEVIFDEGEPATELFLLLQGCVFLGAKFSLKHGTISFARITPPDFFRLVSHCAPSPRDCSCRSRWFGEDARVSGYAAACPVRPGPRVGLRHDAAPADYSCESFVCDATAYVGHLGMREL